MATAKRQRRARLHVTVKIPKTLVDAIESLGEDPSKLLARIGRRHIRHRQRQLGESVTGMRFARMSQAAADHADVLRLCSQLRETPTGVNQIMRALGWGKNKLYRVADLAVKNGDASAVEGRWIRGQPSEVLPVPAAAAPTEQPAPTIAIEQKPRPAPIRQPPTQPIAARSKRALFQVNGGWRVFALHWIDDQSGRTSISHACGGRVLVKAGDCRWECDQCGDSGEAGEQ